MGEIIEQRTSRVESGLKIAKTFCTILKAGSGSASPTPQCFRPRHMHNYLSLHICKGTKIQPTNRTCIISVSNK